MLRGLHKLCDKGYWEDVSTSLGTKTGRENAQEKGGWGDWSPLHLACKRNPPQEIILSLVEAAPKMIECCDMYQRFPIHHAAEWGASLDAINILCAAKPKTLMAVDIDGKSPLHLTLTGCSRIAQQKRCPPSVGEIQKLSSEKEVLKIADKQGNLPIHLACKSLGFVSLDSLKILVKGNKEGLEHRNSNGDLPIHLVLTQKMQAHLSLDVLKILLGNGNVAQIKNHEGKLPLHIACAINANFDVLDTLLLQNNFGASTKDLSGKYPIEILEQHRSTLKANDEFEELNYKSDLLFAHFPDILPHRRDPKRLQRLEGLIAFEAKNSSSLSDVGAMFWSWLCTFRNTDCDEVYTASINRIVEECKYDGNAIKMLLNTKTSEGIRIRECLNSARGAVLHPYMRFLGKYSIEKGSTIFHEGRTSALIALDDITDSSNKKTREVILHFESNKNKFLRRNLLHETLTKGNERFSINHFVPQLLQTYDADRVGTIHEEAWDKEFCSQLNSQEHLPKSVQNYRYATAMIKGESSLDYKVWHHKLSVKENINMAYKIANALDHVHERKISYSNLELRNILLLKNNDVSFIDFGCASIFSREYMLGSHMDIKRSHLSPELIARLNPNEHKRYLKYWKKVVDYATLYDLFYDDEILNIKKIVNSFVGFNSNVSFQTYWENVRFYRNLWHEIEPDKSLSESCFGEMWYYVPKCYIAMQNSTLPFNKGSLPYDLIPSSPLPDIFQYGILLLDLFDRGKPRCNRNWSIKCRFHENCVDFNRLHDPLLRNLCGLLLSNVKKRPNNMHEVLLHPFFKNWGTERLKDRQAITREEFFLTKEKCLKEQIKNQLIARTIPAPSIISIATQMKIKQCTSSQWKKILPNDRKWEFIFPTSFFILPYETLIHDQSSQVTALNTNLLNQYGNYLAQVTHLCALTSVIESCEAGFVEKEDTLVKFTTHIKNHRMIAANFVCLCEKITLQVSFACNILAESLSPFVDNPHIQAEVLVMQEIREYVDLKKCKEITKKVEELQGAFSKIINGVVTNPDARAKEIIYEQVEPMSDTSFKEMVVKNQAVVEASLINLIKKFSENPKIASKTLLREKIHNLLKLFNQKGYFYFVDELDGTAVVSTDDSFPIEIDLETVRSLLPSMLLVINSVCSADACNGLPKLLGLKTEESDLSSSDILNGIQHILLQEDRPTQLLVFKSALCNQIGLSYESANIELQSLKHFKILRDFIMREDPYSGFAGLMRLKTADNSIVWTSFAKAKKAERDGYNEICSQIKLRSKYLLQPSTEKNTVEVNTNSFKRLSSCFDNVKINQKSPKLRKMLHEKSVIEQKLEETSLTYENANTKKSTIENYQNSTIEFTRNDDHTSKENKPPITEESSNECHIEKESSFIYKQVDEEPPAITMRKYFSNKDYKDPKRRRWENAISKLAKKTKSSPARTRFQKPLTPNINHVNLETAVHDKAFPQDSSNRHIQEYEISKTIDLSSKPMSYFESKFESLVSTDLEKPGLDTNNPTNTSSVSTRSQYRLGLSRHNRL